RYSPGTLTSSGGNLVGNIPMSLLERWRQPGDDAVIQKFMATASSRLNHYSYAQLSDAGYSDDASYIRLRTLTLSYLLPQRLISNVGLKSCNLYIQGQNLFTLTKFDGWDPQYISNSGIP